MFTSRESTNNFCIEQVNIGKEEVKVALLSALLLPVRALESKGKKGKSLPVVPLIVGESMKWKKSYASLAAEVQAQAPELLKVYQTLQVTISSPHVFLVKAAQGGPSVTVFSTPHLRVCRMLQLLNALANAAQAESSVVIMVLTSTCFCV